MRGHPSQVHLAGRRAVMFITVALNKERPNTPAARALEEEFRSLTPQETLDLCCFLARSCARLISDGAVLTDDDPHEMLRRFAVHMEAEEGR